MGTNNSQFAVRVGFLACLFPPQYILCQNIAQWGGSKMKEKGPLIRFECRERRPVMDRDIKRIPELMEGTVFQGRESCT